MWFEGRVKKNNQNVPCTQEEFNAVCIETGKTDDKIIREAIAGFQAQAEGIMPGNIKRDPAKVTVPTSINDNILIVDLCDVPVAEKSAMTGHIGKGFMDAYNAWVKNEGPIPLLNINYLN